MRKTNTIKVYLFYEPILNSLNIFIFTIHYPCNKSWGGSMIFLKSNETFYFEFLAENLMRKIKNEYKVMYNGIKI